MTTLIDMKRTLRHTFAALGVLALCRLPLAAAMCPSRCNGHGTCSNANTCICFDGYSGFDCYKRECPRGIPWVGVAVADDDMRSVATECSSRGWCDRDSGRCNCDAGFMGHACSRLRVGCSADTKCNGHGRCLSMREVAAARNDYNLFSTATYTVPWDADRIFGCVCDYGFAGVDCAQPQCPFGDDPVSTGQVDEIQALSCQCASCSGSLTLSFRGETTRALDVQTETASSLKAALEELETIRTVSVALDSGATLCTVGGVSALITFTHDHGDVPALVVTSSITGTVALTLETDGTSAAFGAHAVTQRGTKEWLPCSGRGYCQYGLCICDPGFESSNGLGAQGTINDCGFRSGGAMTTCNGGARCNGHGTCSGAPTFTCTCNRGYSGHNCMTRECPKGRAWFEEPQTNDVAHLSRVPCSNAGSCNGIGRCLCVEGFEGTACDRLSCPRTSEGVCNNRGLCRTARELAAKTPTASFGTTTFVYGADPNAVATWDADMVQGCMCDKVHSHRSTSVRYTGHNCAKIPCPSGDDPWTPHQVDEVQTVVCAATGGSFALAFRGETTRSIAATASANDVVAVLERLRTITSVSVAFSTGVATACTAAGNVMTVTFHSPTGDLPLLSVATPNALTHASGAVATSVVEVTAGSKEDVECNNRGRCDEDSGQCRCALHHASSNARGDYGVLDDCGVVDAFMTHGEL